MNPVSIFRSYRSLQRTQWLDRQGIKALQERKLKKIVYYAYKHVPYYRERFDGIGLKPQDIKSLDDLDKIPVTSKSDLQNLTPADKTSDEFCLQELSTEHSSGSTGQPFTTYFDKQFVATRNNMFLRALSVMGYRPGHVLMLITAGHNRKKPWLRWHYASIESPANELVTQLNNVRPRILYGCTTPLRLMALYVQQTGQNIHQPKTIISTAETLDTATRTLLEDTFGATVYDLYGLTEMGLVAWQCPKQQGYHLSEDTTIIEFEKNKNCQADKLIMTNLELTAMPLIRYQTGDLATAIEDTVCSCGRHTQRIKHIEGRLIDCIRLTDGSLISPYRITLAIENISGIGRYQIIQTDNNGFTVRVEKNSADQKIIETQLRAALHSQLGSHVLIEVCFEYSLTTQARKKFRIIENRNKLPRSKLTGYC